jgi:xylulokinase
VFFGLSLTTPRSAFIRAILEGTAFALRHNMDVAQQAGVAITEIRSVGGGTQSQLWNQIKADVLGVPILIPQTSVGAPFADAILVGMGLGIYQDVKASLQKMIRFKARYEPNRVNYQIYTQIYGVFRKIYENLREEFDRLAGIYLK